MSTQTEPHRNRRLQTEMFGIALIVTLMAGMFTFTWAMMGYPAFMTPDPATLPSHTTSSVETVTGSVIEAGAWEQVNRVTTSNGITTTSTCGNDDFKVGDTVVVTTVTYGTTSKTAIGHAACDADLIAESFDSGLWPEYPVSAKDVLHFWVVFGIGAVITLIGALTARAFRPGYLSR